jgi:glycosyltransferase involved in cell wall biosynthesis
VPTVSIGIPVYNGAGFIAEAIESVLSQEFTDFELIIADNSSADDTYAICCRYAAEDNRIKVVRHPRNIGAAQNYKYVFHCSQGQYFSWLASDDLLRPGFLSACLEGFSTSSIAPVLVYPSFDFIDEQGATLTRDCRSPHAISPSPIERLKHTLDNQGFVTALFGVFRREALKKTRLIGSFASSDYVLLAECALLGSIVRLEGPPLFCRRLHSGRSRLANTTAEEIARWFDPDAPPTRDEYAKLQREYLFSVFTIAGLNFRQRLSGAILLCRRRTARVVRRLKRRLKESLPVRPSASVGPLQH